MYSIFQKYQLTHRRWHLLCYAKFVNNTILNTTLLIVIWIFFNNLIKTLKKNEINQHENN